MLRDDAPKRGNQPLDVPETDSYEHPEVTDHGSLRELTLSGHAALSDMFGGAAGGGS
jgi:hypothetical protein